MQHALSELSPHVVWDYFYQLTQIPRPSKHEEKIQAFMMAFGQSLGLETLKDKVGNIIIKKPATAGHENRKTVVLQSHLDMVPQANSDTPHDFITDPISAYIDGEWVTAKGTTLGADNGIGVAAIMAVLAADDIEHAPLEALFTCDEETGMTGAFELKNDVLQGDILLNLDSEDEKELYVGCAGGVDAVFTLPIARQTAPENHQTFEVIIKGLKGGHSGIDIILQRGNANKCLARLLSQFDNAGQWHLQQFNGGNLRNAIPREARALITADPTQLHALQAVITDFKTTLSREYGKREPNTDIQLQAISDSSTDPVLSTASQRTVLATLNACPNGVHRMSIDMADLVETSVNLAIVSTHTDNVVVECLLRSSVDSARDELATHIRSVFDLAEAKSRFVGAYPGWQPNPSSEILTVMKQTGKQLFGKTPAIKGIHAGLECGILGGTYPHWDMISFGPTIRAPHSPDEKVHITSVESFYTWLLATLKNIPEK